MFTIGEPLRTVRLRAMRRNSPSQNADGVFDLMIHIDARGRRRRNKCRFSLRNGITTDCITAERSFRISDVEWPRIRRIVPLVRDPTRGTVAPKNPVCDSRQYGSQGPPV